MIKRQLIELAIEAGRHFQSEQTKFIHYNAYAEEGSRYDTIPVSENFLFCLALLRSRKADNIQEAKLLLERLLSYQTPPSEKGAGNFPIYLHEFPICYSRWNGARILPALFWIVKNFQHILGEKLREQMRSCLVNLSRYCLQVLKDKPADYLTTLKIGSGGYAVGLLMHQSELESQGGQILEDLQAAGPQPIWYSREGIADILTSLHMVYETLSTSPWKQFWEHVEEMWHPGFHAYCGPEFDEWQRGFIPEPAIYDLYMSSYSGMMTSRVCPKDLCCLQAALIHQGEDALRTEKTKDVSGSLGETEWRMISGERYAYSLINQHSIRDPQIIKGLRLFSLQWVHDDKHYSLTCEGGHIGRFSYEVKGSEVDLFFTLPRHVSSEHPLENRELIFFCTAHDGLAFNVEGVRATTFKFDEMLTLNSSMPLSMTFSLIEGEGEFIGHLMPGNRPSQSLVSKRHPADAHDWQIFLRTIRKKTPCTVRVTLRLDQACC